MCVCVCARARAETGGHRVHPARHMALCAELGGQVPQPPPSPPLPSSSLQFGDGDPLSIDRFDRGGEDVCDQEGGGREGEIEGGWGGGGGVGWRKLARASKCAAQRLDGLKAPSGPRT